MLRKMRQRMNQEEGFTLIELLVVILIIGILAAIALPTFLGQQSKGQDASAKSDARNMVSQVESCNTDQQNYANCASSAALATTGLAWGTGAGQVSVTTAAANTYTVEAVSKSTIKFDINKQSDGTVTRTCSVPAGAGSIGGCKGATVGGSGTW